MAAIRFTAPAAPGPRSQSEVSTNGEDPSAAGWLAAPGQRLSAPVCSASKRCSGGIALSTPPAALSENWNALKIGWMRA